MYKYKFTFKGMTIALICCVGLLFPLSGYGDTAQENYEKFLTIYRMETPSVQQLNKGMDYLKAAHLLKPDVYKYVFALGALNNTLKHWEDAIYWLEKAKHLATTPDQLDAIESELSYCQTQLAKLNVSEWGNQGVSISFIMKQGTVEMGKETIEKLPKRFPQTAANDPDTVVENMLGASLKPFKTDLYKKAPFIIVGLNDSTPAADHYENGVKDFYAFFKKTYFDTDFDRPVVVIVSSHPYDLIQATQMLYPQIALPVYAPFLGYFNPSDNLIMATGGRTGYGTLLHEMIHAFIAVDFPDAPEWLNEGLASLYERTHWKNSRITPLPNWRMDGMHEEDIPSLHTLSKQVNNSAHQRVNVRDIRLMLLYLDKHRKVADLYHRVRQEKTGFDLEKALSQMELTEQGWKAFTTSTFKDYRVEIAKNKGALSNPDEVRFLQQALNQILDLDLEVDGIWGSATRQKLMELQKHLGLKPDGILGPKTLTQLKQHYTLKRLNRIE